MSNFTIHYNVTGDERERLVRAISDFMKVEAVHPDDSPSDYLVDYITIDEAGNVSFDSRSDTEEIEGMIEMLVEQGFIANDGALEADTAAQDGGVAEVRELARGAQVADVGADSADTEGLTISIALDDFSPDSLARLQKLVDSKAALIKKALGADRVTIEILEDRVNFHWWDTMPTPEETRAYLHFISALCQMAKESKRVTATERDVESEKYAFRCFLLRLGFIGDESKADRKILLRRLSGVAAFPNKEKADAFIAAQKIRKADV